MEMTLEQQRALALAAARARAEDAPSTVGDVVKGTVSGLAKGGALALGAPNEIAGLVQGGVDWTRRKITGKTEQQEKDEAKATVGSILDRLGGRRVPMDDTPVRVTGSPNPASAENLTRMGDAGMGGVGPSYQPKTTLGHGAKTLAEFAPGALIPGSALQRGAQVVLPAAGSEAGRAAGGTIGGVAGGVAGSLIPSVLGRDPYIARRLGRAASGVTEQQFDDAARLAADGRQRGIPPTAAEAIISQAPQARGLATMQRIAESAAPENNALARLYSDRPRAMATATDDALNRVAPRSADADYLGRQIQDAAGRAGMGLERQRTAATSPHYTAAATDRVPEANMRGVLAELDRDIARDPTGIVAGPLRELRDRLIERPARPGTPAQRTPVLGPNGQVVRYDHTPAVPPTPEMPITDIDNLDRVRKYFRELPETGLDATTKEQRAQVGRYLDRVNMEMLAASPELRAGRTVHQNLSQTLVDPPMAGPLGTMGGTQKIEAQGSAIANPVSSPQAVRRDVGYLAGQDPALARGVVREELGMRADRTVGGLDAGAQPDQYGGARFARSMRGNPREAANINAAIETAAGVPVRDDIQRLVDALQATGNRQRPGSMTAFNEEFLGDTKRNPLVQTLLKPLAKTEEAYGRVRVGRQMNNLAEILAAPDGVRRIQEFAGRGSDSARILARLLLAEQAARE
jgi:hypothetical protein